MSCQPRGLRRPKGEQRPLFRVKGEALLWSEPWAGGAEQMACWVPSETPSWGVRLPSRPWAGEGRAQPRVDTPSQGCPASRGWTLGLH